MCSISMRLLFIATFTLLTSSTLTPAQEFHPSFSCEKATSLDEKSICSDARLAELDRIHALEYAKARQKNRIAADKEASGLLRSRGNCGNDRVCIFDILRYSLPSASVPNWVDSYREFLVQDVTNDDLSRKSLASVGRIGSFALSSKGVQGTLVAIENVETSHVSAIGQITDADYKEYCERDPGGETIQNFGKLTVKQCIIKTQRESGQIRFQTRADCRSKNVILWDGTWKVISFDNGITWRNPQGKIEEPWAGTTAPEAQFELLCPNSFAQIRAKAAILKKSNQ